MRKIILSVFFLYSLQSHSQVESVSQGEIVTPKVKAFLVVSGYGAAGGALLGLASLAFGSDSKAIAQGASLGLYAGMVFGTYILMTHGQSYNGMDNYDDYSRDYDGGFSTSIRNQDFQERYSLRQPQAPRLIDINFLNLRF